MGLVIYNDSSGNEAVRSSRQVGKTLNMNNDSVMHNKELKDLNKRLVLLGKRILDENEKWKAKVLDLEWNCLNQKA